MNVYVENRQTVLPISSEAVTLLVKAVLAFEKQRCDEVGVHFVETQEICDLHRQYFNDPSPTDCISFPIDGISDNVIGYRVLGDVFVCPQVAKEYAAANCGDTYQELTLYVVHGLLHLMGYDDIEDKDRLLMRKGEDRHMKNLQKLDLCLR